jgi:hypothetical protein
MDTLPSGVPQEAGSRSALAVSDFRLRARLGFTIPSFFPRPARHYPRFRIWRPSSKRQRDFNPPDLGAAQHTLQATPPLCPASVLSRSWGHHLRFSLNIGATDSHVPHQSLYQVHAAFMPDAAWAVNRSPPDLSRVNYAPRF